MHDLSRSDEPVYRDDMHTTRHAEESFKQGISSSLRDNSAVTPGTLPSCPKCHSSRVDTRNLARKTGGAIGTVAGATSGVAFALSGAETGAAVGVLAGPVGAVCGAVAGAVIAGLIGGAAGCATGSMFGEIVDDRVLDNFRCHACGHIFGAPK